jgi:Arc/MetJ family transcription regulator
MNSPAKRIEIRIKRCPLAQGPRPMRTTLTIDDTLLAKAISLTGMQQKSAIVREGLKALIERKSARRLARLGGSEPGLEAVPRGRP